MVEVLLGELGALAPVDTLGDPLAVPALGEGGGVLGVGAGLVGVAEGGVVGGVVVDVLGGGGGGAVHSLTPYHTYSLKQRKGLVHVHVYLVTLYI